MMKKLLAVVLALTLSLTLLLPALPSRTAAAVGTESTSGEAAIVVPGVIETMLMTDPDAGRAGRFYAPLSRISLSLVKDLLVGAVKAVFLSNYDTLTDAAIRLEDAAIGNLAMNPDGTSRYDLFTPATGAAESSYAALTESGKWDDVWYGAQIAPELAKTLGDENVFVFTYDWRLGSPTITQRFAAFVDEVKEMTGFDKVDVYCDSYGCQVVASYLYTYGCGNGIGRIVFDSPAWTGTKLFKSLMTDKDELNFHLTDGAKILLDFFMIEPDVRPLLGLLPDRVVQHVAYTFISHAMDEYLLGAAGLWCCCATEDYEEMKAKLLDPSENAALIREVDEAQYGVMRHIPEVLAAAEEAGIQVSVIMNEGIPLMAGNEINGDGVVDAASGSGGECLPLGQTFTDGRTGAHVSPANDYDLTNAFLPERTWVFYGQTHGQSYWDDEARELVTKLMLTDEIASVASDPRFPQFSDSHCPTCDVSLRLAEKGGSVLRPADGAVQAIIRNDSGNQVIVTGVRIDGVSYTASEVTGWIQPGHYKTVTLTPDGAAAPEYGTVTISYIEFDLIPLAKTRTQYFKTELN